MTAAEKIEVAELLGRIHELPERQQERILYVIIGMKLSDKCESSRAA